MDRKTNIKKFNIVFDKNVHGDIEILEQQVHSLYKLDNINFSEESFFNDLNSCNLNGTCLNIAKKSFVKAIKIALANHGIILDGFDYETVDMYGAYSIKIHMDKEFFARNLRKEIREGVDNISGKKLNIFERLYRVPLEVVAYIPHTYLINKSKLTKSAAYKATLEDLITWEKDIIERLMKQIRREY